MRRADIGSLTFRGDGFTIRATAFGACRDPIGEGAPEGAAGRAAGAGGSSGRAAAAAATATATATATASTAATKMVGHHR